MTPLRWSHQNLRKQRARKPVPQETDHAVRFVALDFETASHRPDSACQLGLAVYEEGRLVQQIAQLIRPPRLYFSPRCIAVHGISPQDVKDAPTWDAVWEEHQELFENYPIIAHNAAFDLNVLLASLKAFGLECPYMEYSCSRMIAQRTWPGRTSYALKSAADALALQFRHHDALEDAKVCGEIVLAAAAAMQVSSLEALENSVAVLRGRVQFGIRISPRGRNRGRGSTTAASLQQSWGSPDSSGPPSVGESQAVAREGGVLASSVAERLVRQCEGTRPLDGKHLVLSGRLLGLDHPTAVGFLERLGGVVQRDINLQTTYVIVGTPMQGVESECGSDDRDPLSQRQRDEIDRRRQEGQSIRILTQRQLLALLPGGAAAVRAGLGV